MPSRGFEPANAATKPLQASALDDTATGIGYKNTALTKFHIFHFQLSYIIAQLWNT
jgi:hypothetical protein